GSIVILPDKAGLGVQLVLLPDPSHDCHGGRVIESSEVSDIYIIVGAVEAEGRPGFPGGKCRSVHQGPGVGSRRTERVILRPPPRHEAGCHTDTWIVTVEGRNRAGEKNGRISVIRSPWN